MYFSGRAGNSSVVFAYWYNWLLGCRRPKLIQENFQLLALNPYISCWFFQQKGPTAVTLSRVFSSRNSPWSPDEHKTPSCNILWNSCRTSPAHLRGLCTRKRVQSYSGAFVKFLREIISSITSTCLSVPGLCEWKKWRFPTGRIFWNLAFDYFFKICLENSSFIKFWKE